MHNECISVRERDANSRHGRRRRQLLSGGLLIKSRPPGATRTKGSADGRFEADGGSAVGLSSDLARSFARSLSDHEVEYYSSP